METLREEAPEPPKDEWQKAEEVLRINRENAAKYGPLTLEVQAPTANPPVQAGSE